MPATLRILLVLGLAILAAAPLRSQRRSDLLTAEEIERSLGRGGTAFDVVQSLRPRWLRAHEVLLTPSPDAPITEQGPHVYMNDVDQGDAEYLKTIPAELIAEMRWLSANQAASRYGPTSNPGIVVALKR
jgi:hypothetical protein